MWNDFSLSFSWDTVLTSQDQTEQNGLKMKPGKIVSEQARVLFSRNGSPVSAEAVSKFPLSTRFRPFTRKSV
jgi:hypothetical protein